MCILIQTCLSRSVCSSQLMLGIYERRFINTGLVYSEPICARFCLIIQCARILNGTGLINSNSLCAHLLQNVFTDWLTD